MAHNINDEQSIGEHHTLKPHYDCGVVFGGYVTCNLCGFGRAYTSNDTVAKGIKLHERVGMFGCSKRAS